MAHGVFMRISWAQVEATTEEAEKLLCQMISFGKYALADMKLLLQARKDLCAKLRKLGSFATRKAMEYNSSIEV